MNGIEVLQMYRVVLNLPPLSTFYFPDIIPIWSDFLLIFGWKAVLLLLKALASLLIYGSRSQTPNQSIKKKKSTSVLLHFASLYLFYRHPYRHAGCCRMCLHRLSEGLDRLLFFLPPLKDTKFPAKNRANKNQRWIEITPRHCSTPSAAHKVNVSVERRNIARVNAWVNVPQQTRQHAANWH